MELKEIAQAIAEISKYPAGAIGLTVVGVKLIPYVFPRNGNGKEIDIVKRDDCHAAMDGLKEHIDDKFAALKEKMDEDSKGVRMKLDEFSSNLLDITKNVEWRRR